MILPEKNKPQFRQICRKLTNDAQTKSSREASLALELKSWCYHFSWFGRIDVSRLNQIKILFIFILYSFIFCNLPIESGSAIRAGRRRGLNLGGQEGGKDHCYSMVWYSMAQTPRWLAFLSLICLHVGGLAWLPTTTVAHRWVPQQWWAPLWKVE